MTMMMKAAKLGLAGPGAVQEQGRSRAEQSKAEQGRKRAGAGQELAVISGTLKYF